MSYRCLIEIVIQKGLERPLGIYVRCNLVNQLHI